MRFGLVIVILFHIFLSPDLGISSNTITAVEIPIEANSALKADLFVPELNAKKNKRLVGSGKARTVILLHDAGSDRTQLAGLARRIAKLGFAVINVDLRGHGESINQKLNYAKAEQEKKDLLLLNSERDLKATFEFMKRGTPGMEFFTDSYTLIGFGTGGALALNHLKKDDQDSVGLLIAIELTFNPKRERDDQSFDVLSLLENGVNTRVNTVKVFGSKKRIDELEAELRARKNLKDGVVVPTFVLGDGTESFFGAEDTSPENTRPITVLLSKAYPISK